MIRYRQFALALLLLCFGISVSTFISYAETAHFQTVIEAKYDYARNFSDGLAAVKKQGKFGYIDKRENVIIPFKYDVAWDFSEGMAVVGTLVDSKEPSLIEAKYNSAKLKLGIINRRGVYKPLKKIVYSEDYYEIVARTDYLITLSKDKIFSVVYDKSVNEFKYLRFHFRTNTPYEVTEESEIMSMLDTAQIGTFYNGFVLIKDSEMNTLPRHHFFDEGGREYNFVTMLNDVLYNKLKESIIDGFSLIIAEKIAKGELEAPVSDMMGTSNFGHAPTENLFPVVSDRAYFIDVRTKRILNDTFYLNVKPFNQGLAMVTDEFNKVYQKYQWSFIDKNGSVRVGGAFSDVSVIDEEHEFVIFNDGLAALCDMKGKWGALDKNGRIVIPFVYDGLSPYKEGLFVFLSRGKYGYINAKNQVIIPAVYSDATVFESGLAIVSNEFGTYVINKKAEKVDVPRELLLDELIQGNFGNGLSELMRSKTGGKYGFTKLSHRAAIPQKSEMSDWAYNEVVNAINSDLVPLSLQNLYKNNATRKDFAALVVKTIERVKGKSIEEVYRADVSSDLYEDIKDYRFSDTNDYRIIAAKKLGIINGVGNNSFNPYGHITREQAAALLKRTAKYLGKEVDSSIPKYRDSASISDYAKESVAFVSELNIMNGVGNNTFAPTMPYTRQQAFMTIYRLYESLQ